MYTRGAPYARIRIKEYRSNMHLTHENQKRCCFKGMQRCSFSLTIYTIKHVGKDMSADLQSPFLSNIGVRMDALRPRCESDQSSPENTSHRCILPKEDEDIGIQSMVVS